MEWPVNRKGDYFCEVCCTGVNRVRVSNWKVIVEVSRNAEMELESVSFIKIIESGRCIKYCDVISIGNYIGRWFEQKEFFEQSIP